MSSKTESAGHRRFLLVVLGIIAAFAIFAGMLGFMIEASAEKIFGIARMGLVWGFFGFGMFLFVLTLCLGGLVIDRYDEDGQCNSKILEFIDHISGPSSSLLCSWEQACRRPLSSCSGTFLITILHHWYAIPQPFLSDLCLIWSFF